MAIIGIDTLLYGVEDLASASRFFDDFGLVRLSANDQETLYRLDEGSTIIVRGIEHASIPVSRYEGFGVKETIWGVDNTESLARLVADLSTDRDVRLGDDGAWHFHSDCGQALGLRVFTRKKVTFAPDPINAAG